MDSQQNVQTVAVIRTQPQQSLGCALIDQHGNEITITEDMIQDAKKEAARY